MARRLAPYLDATADAPSPLPTAHEAAVLLRCQRKRIYDFVQRGALPCRRDGGRVLFDRADVNAYLKETG